MYRKVPNSNNVWNYYRYRYNCTDYWCCIVPTTYEYTASMQFMCTRNMYMYSLCLLIVPRGTLYQHSNRLLVVPTVTCQLQGPRALYIHVKRRNQFTSARLRYGISKWYHIYIVQYFGTVLYCEWLRYCTQHSCTVHFGTAVVAATVSAMGIGYRL